MTNTTCENENAIDLSRFDNDFKRADAAEGAIAAVPDGKYKVVVDNVELTETSTTGNPMLRFTLRIIGPQMAGRLIWKNRVITANTLSYLKKELHICGVDLETLSELPQHLERMLRIHLEVNKRTQGENSNVYFIRRLEFTEAGKVESDDIPF